jgi:hypothetical protein
MEIDGGGEDSSEDCVEGAEENGKPESMNNEDEDNGPDQIDNVEESGRNIDDEDTPNPRPLKGYEYTWQCRPLLRTAIRVPVCSH